MNRIRIGSLLAFALLPAANLPAPAAAREDPAPGRAQDAPACRKCGSTGRAPCPEHEEEECPLEDGVLFCSVVADCASCGGTAFVPCASCDNQPARARLEARKLEITARGRALAPLDESMGRALRKAESQHFVLVWDLDRLKVDKRWVAAHELMHLYIARLENLYADYCTILSITDKEFNEKFRVFVWYLQQDHLDGSLRFCSQSAQGGVKLLGLSPSYSVCGNKQQFVGDEQLHRNVVHNVVHPLLSAQLPIAWIGNIKGGWADEGLAHWFEDRIWSVCDNYCYQEQNTNVDFKGGKFRRAVRRMLEEGTAPPMAEVFEQNVDTLTLPMHAVAFSYVDYLLTIDGAKFSALVQKLKTKLPTRDALKQVWSMGTLDFEAAWRAWVLETYPVR